MDSVQAVSQWGEVIAGALLGQLLRRLLLGTGLPARASLWMSITVLALGLGLWFSAASSISGSQLLWYPSMLSFLVVICGAITALILMVRQGQ